jgi:hypothetical protein
MKVRVVFTGVVTCFTLIRALTLQMCDSVKQQLKV